MAQHVEWRIVENEAIIIHAVNSVQCYIFILFQFIVFLFSHPSASTWSVNGCAPYAETTNVNVEESGVQLFRE